MSNTTYSRESLLEIYKKSFPNIENYIESKGRYSFPYLEQVKSINNYKKKEIYSVLVSSIADIRNTNDPISDDSLSIKKTDNQISNEAKKMIKTLINKEMGYIEIVKELHSVYGLGISLSYKGKSGKHNMRQIFFLKSFYFIVNAPFFYILYRIIRRFK